MFLKTVEHRENDINIFYFIYLQEGDINIASQVYGKMIDSTIYYDRRK
jgi:hypothetical protein